MKWFIRLFVALCLFLVGGYALHSQPENLATYSDHHIALPAKAYCVSLAATENPHADISNAVFFKAKMRGVIDDTDDEDSDTEDDETSSSHGSHFTAPIQVPDIAYTGNTTNYAPCVTKALPFREHYLYTSSSRYLVFNVFRI